MTIPVVKRQFGSPISVTDRDRGYRRDDLPGAFRPEPRRSAGLSLFETAIYIAVFTVVAAPIYLMMLESSRSTHEGNILSRVLERNRVSLQRISTDFRGSVGGTHTIGPFGKTLTFTTSGGFDGAGPTAGNVISYSIQDDPDDPFNGVDDNGNGVTDEVVLVRNNQTLGEQLIVATSLDYFGSGFATSGNGITLTVSTTGLTRHSHVPTSMTRTIRLFSRN